MESIHTLRAGCTAEAEEANLPPEDIGHREPSPHSCSAAQSLTSLRSGTEQKKKKVHSHCPPGKQKRMIYYDFSFISCVLAVFSGDVFHWVWRVLILWSSCSF